MSFNIENPKPIKEIIEDIENINNFSYEISETDSKTIYRFKHIKFTFTGYPVSLINSIRRIILTSIPNISFINNEGKNIFDNTINIKKNSTNLHNEMFSHRLSLLPLLGFHFYDKKEKNKNLQIKTFIKNNIRVFEFENPDKVPSFTLVFLENKTNEYLPVYSSNFEIDEGKRKNIIHRDLYFDKGWKSDGYCLLNKLNPNSEIDIVCKPNIGIGKDNSRFCSVGTIEYEFKKIKFEEKSLDFKEIEEALEENDLNDFISNCIKDQDRTKLTQEIIFCKKIFAMKKILKCQIIGIIK